MNSDYVMGPTWVILVLLVSGCTGPSDHKQTSASSKAQNNPEVARYLETNSKTNHYFESLTSEIETSRRVREAIKVVVATNSNVYVQDFHEFLLQWHLHWPVIKNGSFGEGDIGFVRDKDLHKFRGTADSVALIEDRYELQAVLDFEMSEDFKDVVFPKLRFHFTEIRDVEVSPEGVGEGGARVSYETISDRWFGPKEWGRLRASNWNFSSIGITVVSNKPIPNIRQVFKEWN